MSKRKVNYECRDCGTQTPQWAGQCHECGAWNSLTEVVMEKPKEKNARHVGYAGQQAATVQRLDDIEVQQQARMESGLAELDRVLGGGLVQGSVILIGGDPGIGKSTILLQSLAHLSNSIKTLYVTGEESLQQVKLRAERLRLNIGDLNLLAETNVENIIGLARKENPQSMVIDSIQTIFTELVNSAPGSVSQVRESAQHLVRFAKQTGTTIFLVGHVTKEGALAGPRVLEHMVDTVLYFEGRADSRFRLIRAVKNRFGAVNELGVFAMSEMGLKTVQNPSKIFLSKGETMPGSVILATWEGSRPLLVEVQALVDDSNLENPRRVAVGLEQNRLSLCLAVLNRHASMTTYKQDVYVNVVGGLRVTETASDLALILSVVSSYKNITVANDCVVFGEVGLNGEVRPVQSGQERLKEAAKLGFSRAIVPQGNVPKEAIGTLQVVGVKHLQEALEKL